MNNPESDVVVTGVGPVTSVGVGAGALWSSLAAGRSNVGRRTLPVDLGLSLELPVASMPPASEVEGLDRHFEFLDQQDCCGSRDLAYAMLAIELALADAKLEYDRDHNEIGMVQAFEAPGVERTVGRLFEMMSVPPPTDGPPRVYDHLSSFFYSMQPFLYLHVAGKAFGFRGFSTSVHNACSSGGFALEVAAQQVRAGRAEVMLVVGGEAFDTAVRLEWFRRLGLYTSDGRMCPFDPDSSGFYVGEGGAAIVLESAAHAARRGVLPYATYLGGGFAQQSWKQTIPDVRSARLRDVITQALTATGVLVADIDLVVPHGASTLLSDGYEATCLVQAFHDEARQAVATVFKPYVGHMLASSSLIEMICALLAIKQQAVPATLHSNGDRVKLGVPLATTFTERPLKTVLKLSTGFTGHDAAALFAHP